MQRLFMKRLLLVLLVLVILIVIWQRDLISYGLMQAQGQIKIISEARPVSEVLKDEQVPDSIKTKLLLIQEIRNFAIDSLGIKESENYTTFYDQKGKPLLWVVTGSEPYKLVAKEWRFPFIGSFSYKGFFDLEKAKKEELLLKAQNYDTNIGIVGGWSTLGWFKDPILSGMLIRNEGELANLIIHELTHGTIFIKDSVNFNENLASFIGDKGAEKFLSYKFGKDSPEYKNYIQGYEDQKKFIDHILRGAVLLDTLYNSFSGEEPEEQKFTRKFDLIQDIVAETDTIGFHNREKYRTYFSSFVPNNAYFMAYLRYNAKIEDFETEYTVRYKSDLKNYLEYLKTVYPTM